jgi:hypothetical protein
MILVMSIIWAEQNEELQRAAKADPGAEVHGDDA